MNSVPTGIKRNVRNPIKTNHFLRMSPGFRYLYYVKIFGRTSVTSLVLKSNPPLQVLSAFDK